MPDETDPLPETDTEVLPVDTAFDPEAYPEISGCTVALIDLARRPSRLVRGSKRGWAMACFVQPVGPIAYLAFGRR